MESTNRMQQCGAPYNVDFEESTETHIDFDVDVHGKTYTQDSWDDASSKPLDYNKVLQARYEEPKRGKKIRPIHQSTYQGVL